MSFPNGTEIRTSCKKGNLPLLRVSFSVPPFWKYHVRDRPGDNGRQLSGSLLKWKVVVGNDISKILCDLPLLRQKAVQGNARFGDRGRMPEVQQDDPDQHQP